MKKYYQLRLTGKQHQLIYDHLFPGDGLEAAAILLCGINEGDYENGLLVHEIINVPYNICERREGYISWPTEFIEPYLEKAQKNDLSVVKIHCHPNGPSRFSPVDDESDKDLFDYIHAVLEDGRILGSVVMLPDGSLFGRVILKDGTFIPIDKLMHVGNDVRIWYQEDIMNEKLPGYTIRNKQAFGSKTSKILKRMKVGVVGCSGLGSPVIEQLLRDGVGELVLVDQKTDPISEENLNRIYGSSRDDIGILKPDFFKNKIEGYKLGTKVKALVGDVCSSKEIMKKLSTCDFILGCTDKFLPRHLLNRLTTFYLIPYIDMAVGLDGDGEGGIDSILGWVRYMIPGESSLLSRRMYSLSILEVEAWEKDNPEEYKKRKEEKYLNQSTGGRPAVISITSGTASWGLMDFKARIHQYRYEDNKRYAGFCIDFCNCTIEPEDIFPDCKVLKQYVGRGDMYPFLDVVGFDDKEINASENAA